MVGVLRGAFIFMADLVRAIPRELTCDFLGVRSYGDATVSSGVVEITSDLGAPIAGRHVLLVEDIVDTGLTLRYLLDLLRARGPASVHVCALLAKPLVQTSGGPPLDFVGFEAPDAFVVGYGLDAGQLYRNLPGYLRRCEARPRSDQAAEAVLLAAVELFLEAALEAVVALQELEVLLAEGLQVAALVRLLLAAPRGSRRAARPAAPGRCSCRPGSSPGWRRPASPRPARPLLPGGL